MKNNKFCFKKCNLIFNVIVIYDVSVKSEILNTFNTVSYKEQFLIKLASTKNVTFNVSCIKKKIFNGFSYNRRFILIDQTM
jgi:hypothetical protein